VKGTCYCKQEDKTPFRDPTHGSGAIPNKKKRKKKRKKSAVWLQQTIKWRFEYNKNKRRKGSM
jgi:hypothetical protein